MYGAGIVDGQAYLITRYVDGDDLRTHVRLAGRLDVEEAAAITVAVGAALDAIHRAGYVHRDVKPANVLLDANGHVYLSDFGLAKHVLAPGATETGRWVGTLDYAAPEQIRGGSVDARADVYALGGVLYMMLTGAVPFDRDSEEAKLWAHLADPPPRPSALRPELPQAFDGVVQRALAKDPEERHLSAGDLGRAARAAAGGEAAAAERTVARGAAAPATDATLPGLLDGAPTISSRATAGSRRRRRLAAGAVLTLLAAAATTVVLVAVRPGDRPTSDAGQAPPSGQRQTPAAAPRVGETLRPVGFRPRDIAVVDGDVWVISATRKRIERIRASTMRHRDPQPSVGRGAVSVAGSGGAVWAAIPREGRVVKVDTRSGRVLRRVPVPVTPVLVAAGAGGLWVAGRGADGTPDVIFHFDLAGRLLRQVEVPNGVKAMTRGGNRLWVALDDEWGILGFGGNLRTRESVVLTGEATELDYGAGYLWASQSADDSITRYDPRRKLTVTTAVARRPAGVAVGGGRVFVASHTEHSVVVVDPKTSRPVGEPLPMPPNPWAVEAGAGHLWVSGLGASTLSRIDY